MTQLQEEYAKKWGKGPFVAVDAVVLTGQKLLLVQRQDDAWALPGGFVDPGEILVYAARREVNEETSCERFSNFRFKGSKLYSEPGRDPRGHIITIAHYFEGHGFGASLPKIKAGSDAKNVMWYNWFNISDLGNVYADHRKIITDMIRGF